MQHTLVAVFDNRSDAKLAMDELLSSGFSRQDVSLSESSADTTARQAGSGSSPEEGSFGQGFKKFFSSMFGTDEDDRVQKYAEAVTRGHHVLTVSTADEQEAERAADIVERHGPVDIDEKAAQWGGAGVSGETMRMGAGAQQQAASMSQQNLQGGQDMQGAQATSQGGTLSGSQQRAANVDSTTAIPVIQEQLRVGKREVQRGGVRIFQRLVETPVNETVNLREEHVSVERRPVDQPASAADLSAFEEKSIELRETAEEAVVEKTARVVEEVVVGKEVTQRQEQISDTVRRTEVEVEQLGAGYSDADDQYYRQHYDTYLAGTGGSYDEYAPAYSYGSSMASDARYSGRMWDDVEPRLRSDWESRHPASTWERIKGAVRYGWDKITS